jgi:hypothetical protein
VLDEVLLTKELSIVAVCIAGGLAYPLLVLAFGGVTPAEVRQALRRPAKAPPASPTDLL